MRAPWPVSLLVIGDSYSSNGALTDWTELYQANHAGNTVVNAADSGKCLYDATGPLGADTVVASIAADLVANPGADIVCWATSAGNDILRRKQGLNSVLIGDLTTAANTVFASIQAADKRAIVMCCPFTQSQISGFGPGTDADANTAYALMNDFNAWLRTACEARSFVYYEPKWLWKDLGPLETGNGNGILADYFTDGLHPNALGAALIAEDFGAMVRAMPYRIAA